MRNFQRVIAGADVGPLRNAVQRTASWNENTLRTTHEGTVHGEVDDIWLRFNEITEDVIDDTECVDYPAFAKLSQARALIFDLMRYVEGTRLGRVIVTRLKPGGKILPHRDEGAPATYYERYQVVLDCPEGCTFRIGDESVQMRSGEVWWIDNREEHEVVNLGHDDRLVMIVDIRC